MINLTRTFFIAESKNSNLIAFSMYTNGEKLFKCSSHSRSKSPDVLECITGIRVLSITWVVFGHSYATFKTGSFNIAELLTVNLKLKIKMAAMSIR